MTRDNFRLQIQRLQKTWGERYYPAERVELYWRAFSADSDGDFISAVEWLIARSRQPPMLEDIEKAVEEARTRRKTEEQRGRDASFAAILREAEKRNGGLANRELVRTCVDLVERKCRGKISPQHFDEGMALVDTMVGSLHAPTTEPARTAPAKAAGPDRRMHQAGERDDD